VAIGATSSSLHAGHRGGGGQFGGCFVHSASRSGETTPPATWHRPAAAVFTLILLVANPAQATEPLCDALAGLGGAAEALRRGQPAAGVHLARTARAALPRGPIQAQATAILALALLRTQGPAEAEETFAAALAAPELDLTPSMRGVLERARRPADRPAEDRSGRVTPEPTGPERLQRAELLLQQGQPASALAEAELAAASSPPAPAAPATLLQAIALAALGRLDEASELALPLSESGEAGVRRGANWLLARAASRAGRTGEATARYASVAEGQALVPGLGERRSRDLADESAYLSAWLWYDAGQFGRAVSRLDAFARARPASPRAADARWFAAWASFRTGDRRAAQARLQRLESGPLADAALYWHGRLSGSRERLRRAAIAGGDGWYGWLARRRLAQLRAPAPPWPAIDLPAQPGSSSPGPSQLGEAVALLSFGWREAALQELESKAQRGTERATVLDICRLATFAGEPALALRVARDLLGQARSSERWLYPAPFEELLPAVSRATGLDAALLLALVRRESGFSPEARSLAGALGLGQLLPSTADRLGALTGLATAPALGLGDPATNLPLAALYLGLLRDRFGNDAAALAAYNAGPAAPAAWIGSRAAMPLDEWVENVPYKETRTYVKAVLSAREVYRRLEGLPPLLDPAALVTAPGEGVAF